MTAVLVTGANRGIGLEFVRQYAADGARVFACARDPARASELNALAAKDPKVSVHPLDVADARSVETLASALKSERLDILINNAGLVGVRTTPIDFALWEELFRVNTIGPFRMAQAFRPNLMKGSTRQMVTITSRMGSTADSSGGYYDYRSSKAAVNNVMHGLALDWAGDRFMIVVVHPGWVQTDMGGAGASLAPKDSVNGMRRLIAGLKPSDSGKYLNYNGNEIPW